MTTRVLPTLHDLGDGLSLAVAWLPNGALAGVVLHGGDHVLTVRTDEPLPETTDDPVSWDAFLLWHDPDEVAERVAGILAAALQGLDGF